MIENYGSVSKKALKRQKVDVFRPLRVVKYIDFSFVLENSPVEIEEGYIVADKDTGEVFASFIFKNLSNLPIKNLNIKLDFYLNNNCVPYKSIDFEYSRDELTFGIIKNRKKELKVRECNKRTLIYSGESFGSCVFVPIPENYFKKLEVTLVSVVYSNGTTENINQTVTGKKKLFSELDDISKTVYNRMNIYQSAEHYHPTIVIPQFGNKVWLCCCGNKNPASSEKCEVCAREKEYQQKNFVQSAIDESVKNLVSDPTEITFHDKTKYSQNKHLENDADIQKKIEAFEKSMENVERAEIIRQKRLWSAPIRVLIWIIGVLSIKGLLELIMYLLSL